MEPDLFMQRKQIALIIEVLLILKQMKKLNQLFYLTLAFALSACSTSNKTDLSSPNGQITVSVHQNVANHIEYVINAHGKQVMLPSELGLLREDADFYSNMSIYEISETKNIQNNYELLSGKQSKINYNANEQVIHSTNKDGKKLDIIFRVSNDGVAFRYHFPELNDQVVKITEEKTTYHFPNNTTCWLQPAAKAKSGWCETNPSYEEYYKTGIPAGTSSPMQSGWVYPALFNSSDNWIAITETALDHNYCGTRLTVKDSINSIYQVSFPNPLEIMPKGEFLPNSTLPMNSPWRVLAIGSLKTVVESTLGTDLSDPSIDMDFSFVKPGLASWSWIILKDNNIIYDVQKKYIDFAADMKWKYCLIDVNWDRNIGYDKMKELVSYANEKGIGVLLWYNSSGDWNSTTYSPKSKLLTFEDREKEFALLEKMGVKGIKVDFFGGDGQSVIAYYHDIIQDAAKYHLMINCHGATLPRGWQRTYPNLVTFEAVRGFENVTFQQVEADQQPIHCTMQPFTRNLFDPMDYTPMNLTEVPNIQRRTLPSFELALPIIFQSGIQHLAETPDGMAKMPPYVITYLADCPATWDETKFMEGYPGKYVVLARRSGDHWYIGGINAEDSAKTISLDLSFINGGVINLITDGENEKVFKHQTIDLSENPTLKITLKSNGGFTIY